MIPAYFDTIPIRLQPLFENGEAPWEPLEQLEPWIKKTLTPGNFATIKGDVYIEGDVEIGEGTVIEHGAVIIGPVIIGKNCQIRAGAYIRGHVVVGDNCVIGHATEVIRSVLMDNVRIDHFNYVGDSILGNGVHFGAGAKVANVRFDKKEIMIDGQLTGRKKFGVVLGDRCQLGVNVTVGPGVLFEKDTWYAQNGLLKSGTYNNKKIRA